MLWTQWGWLVGGSTQWLSSKQIHLLGHHSFTMSTRSDLWRSQECRLLFGNALEFFDLSLWLIEMDHHHHPVYYSYAYAHALPGPLDKCTASGEEAAPMNRSSLINSTVEDLLLLDWQWIIILEYRREGKSPSINRTWMMTDYFRGFTSIGTIPSPTSTTIGNKQQPSQESTCNGGNRNPSIAWLSRNYNSVNALSWPNRISTKRGEQDRVIRWSPILDHLVSVCFMLWPARIVSYLLLSVMMRQFSSVLLCFSVPSSFAAVLTYIKYSTQPHT